MSHPYQPSFSGKGVSKGIAVGKIWVFHPETHAHAEKKGQGVEVELTRFKQAQRKVLSDLQRIIETTRNEIGPDEAEIFEAHQMMIQDEELVAPILYILEHEHLSTEVAVEKSFHNQIVIFEASDSEYMRERALDLKDLKAQLLSALDPSEKPGLSKLLSPILLVAEDLTPSQTITLDRKNVLGIITEKGGETSHTAIIARTLGIPAITGAAGAMKFFSHHDQVAMDGQEGSLFIVQSPEMKNYFISQIEIQNAGLAKSQNFKGKPTLTSDMHIVNLYCNIGNVQNAQKAKEGDGEGVGLYRTEFLFMERNVAPTLEEQRDSYAQVLDLFAPKEVIIRTLDVGGDKPISYINIPKEDNPFLGMRAVRYCIQNQEFFKTQIKAMLLANRHGNLSIMLPMVSRASEAKECVALIHESHQELLSDSKYAKKPYKVGAMVEIPSLIFELRELKEFVSFVSVGTNDLLQYSVAVDRMNQDLQHLYSPYNIGFVRMMNILAKEAIAAGLELGICGELAGNENFIPLWIAMGYQKLSMTATEVLPKRALVSRFTFARCKNLLKEVLSLKNETEVKFRLTEFIKRERSR